MSLNLTDDAQLLFDRTIGALANATFSASTKPAYDAFRGVFGTHFMTQQLWGGREELVCTLNRTTFDE